MASNEPDTDAFSGEEDGVDTDFSDVELPGAADDGEPVNGDEEEPALLPDDAGDGDERLAETPEGESEPSDEEFFEEHTFDPTAGEAPETVGDAPEAEERSSTEDDASEPVNGSGTGDSDGDEYDAVDPRGLNENPKTASPNVDPADVTVDGSVSTRVKAQLSGGDAGSDVHGISQGKPTEDYVSLHVRLVRTHEALDDHGDAVGTIATVTGETGTTTVKVSDLLADVHDCLDPTADSGNIEPGDEIVISGVEWSRDGEIGFEASRCTDVVRVESDEYPVGYWLEQASELDRLGEIFEDAQNQPEAWNRIADVIASEVHLAVPHAKTGDPTWWLYIDDQDRDDYGLWTPEGKSRVEELLSAHLPYTENDSRHRREIVRNVKQRCRVEPDEFASGVPDDADLKWMVGVENGVVDLRTGELHPHGPEWRLRSKVRTEYDPDAAQTPAVDELGPGLREFVSGAAKNENDAKLLIDMTAHSLMRNYSVKAWFPIVGPTDSGKSWWVETICSMLGDDLSSEINFPKFAAGDGFETGKIRDVHVAIDDDATAKKTKDINFLKKVTGGRGASINRKYERLEDYTPYSTVITLNNNPSVIEESDDSVLNRIYPVELPHRHTEDPTDEHRDKIPEKDLAETTRSDEELQQLLAVAVEAAGELYRTNEPRDSRSEEERWELYNEYADHSRTFFKTCLTSKLGAKARKDAVHETYVQMCHERDVDPMAPSQFWTEAKNSAFISYERGKWDGDHRAVGSVMLTERAIEQYAPDWVLEEYEDEVETGGHTNPSDRVTDLSDLGWNRVGAVEARVKARDHVDRSDEVGVELLIEDDNAPMDLFEDTYNLPDDVEAETDGVNVGDKVRVEYPAPERDDRGRMRLAADRKTTITVIEPGPLSTREHTDDDDQKPLPDDAGDEDHDGEQGTGEDTGEETNAGDEEPAAAAVEADGGEVVSDTAVGTVDDVRRVASESEPSDDEIEAVRESLSTARERLASRPDGSYSVSSVMTGTTGRTEGHVERRRALAAVLKEMLDGGRAEPVGDGTRLRFTDSKETSEGESETGDGEVVSNDEDDSEDDDSGEPESSDADILTEDDREYIRRNADKPAAILLGKRLIEPTEEAKAAVQAVKNPVIRAVRRAANEHGYAQFGAARNELQRAEDIGPKDAKEAIEELIEAGELSESNSVVALPSATSTAAFEGGDS